MGVDPNAPRETERITQTTSAFTPSPDLEIGPYRLLRQLGEGGMGLVYHAQQLRPIQRDVALKIIKPGMDSREVIARFESERQALAMMEHPNIARVFDAGTTPAKLPFFVMELVQGVPIHRYCESKRLTVRQRIELFIPVCRAIQHAHQKGIIHRDIKPSNVLVMESEGKPVPKVIDFGLAKALGLQLGNAEMLTSFGSVMGTLDYMSPEQAELGRRDIDTRSDGYSLGALLYQLLTEATPLDCDWSRHPSYLEVLTLIREKPVQAPSTKVRFKGKAASLDRELDWIVMKALEKDRAQRYETVNGFARDLERYLAGEPVEAGPSSNLYRFGKFARKYRWSFATALAFLIMMTGAGAISTVMGIRARRAEATTNAVNDFLKNDLLSQASTFKQQGAGSKTNRDLTVREALDRASQRLQSKFSGQPAIEASLRQTIGTAYLDLGLYSEAQALLERARDLRRRALGDNDKETLASTDSLAALYERRGNYDKAEPLYRQLVDIETKTLGPEHPYVLHALNGLAVTYIEQGRLNQALEVLSRLVPVQQRVLGPDNFETLRSMGNYAGVLSILHKNDQAKQLFAETLEREERALGPRNPETLGAMTNLGNLYVDVGEFDKARPLLERALGGFREVLGPGHPNTILATNAVSELYRVEGDYAQAETLLRRALEEAGKGAGGQHPETLESNECLTRVLLDQKRYAEAAKLAQQLLDARVAVLGKEHPDTLASQVLLGEIRLHERQYEKAETLLREACAGFQKVEPDDWQRFQCDHLLGESLAGQKKYVDAEPLLTSGYEGMSRVRAAIPQKNQSGLKTAGERIVTFYQDWGKADKASEWRAKVSHL